MRLPTLPSLFVWFVVTIVLARAGVPAEAASVVASAVPPACSASNPDGDADGVADGCDRCLGYDDQADEDDDGVPDGCDVCPGFSDAIDQDGDGVADGCDPCLGHDDQVDEDGDEIPDGCDQCDGQPDWIDADKDSVPDACDMCADSDDRVDADRDLVPDGCDACPGSDDRRDLDADAVPDGCDVCPGVDDTARDTIDPLVCTFGAKLSLTSRKASLVDVLEALAAVQPLRFAVPDDLAAKTVTVSVEKATLEDAIRRVLQGSSYTLTYPPPDVAARDGGSLERIALVTVLADAQAAPAAASMPATPESDPAGGETAASRDVVREARYGRDPVARAAAVRSLGGTPEDPVARNTILLALRDPAPGVRGAALDVAGQFGRYVGIQHLAEIASSDSEPELRKQALLRLTEIDYPTDTASTYVRKALDDPDAGVSSLARELLDQLATR